MLLSTLDFGDIFDGVVVTEVHDCAVNVGFNADVFDEDVGSLLGS
jgi:hypothetical protein